MPNWDSSYERNNYGDFFYGLIRVYKPKKVVELGTKLGYSAYHIARALRANNKGTLDCYDLWEDYIEYFGMDYISKLQTENNLKEFKDIISLHLGDAVKVYEKYDSVDILHVDLENDADVLEKVIPNWIDKVKQLIIIEGGSAERDQLASKTNQKRLPIEKWLGDIDIKNDTFSEGMLDPNESRQFILVGGKEKYKEKPIAPWLEKFNKGNGNIEYTTIKPFPSLTLIRKK